MAVSRPMPLPDPVTRQIFSSSTRVLLTRQLAIPTKCLAGNLPPEVPPDALRSGRLTGFDSEEWRMKFGVLLRSQDPPNAANIVQRWQEQLRAAEVLEEAGFDGVFLPEHHMMDDGYPHNPWPALGALAARTKRIPVGTTVHLLPFYHPIHVAEA